VVAVADETCRFKRVNNPGPGVTGTEKEKWGRGSSTRIAEGPRHRPGPNPDRPTTDVAKSEKKLSTFLLKRRGVKARAAQRQGRRTWPGRPEIVAPGRPAEGGPRSATNMAGRGTDIILGGKPGNPCLGAASSSSEDADNPAALPDPASRCRKDLWKQTGRGDRVEGADEGRRAAGSPRWGGLHIVGTERARGRGGIDNQLRGPGRPAGGDPGSGRFLPVARRRNSCGSSAASGSKRLMSSSVDRHAGERGPSRARC